jgi:20S proteasome alpha/beta subunit
MTLVLALCCRDGAVIASDGQATSDAAGQPTRAPMRKLFDTAEQIAWGAAGSVGLQQTLRRALAALDPDALATDGLRDRLGSLVIPIQQAALRDFVPHPGCEPPELACLFCWWDGGERPGRARILSVPRTGADHQFHDVYAAIGSGDIFAALTMRSIAHLGIGDLSLEQAKMVAYRAVADAIDVAALFLGPPLQMYTVTADGAAPVPREEIDHGVADAVDLWRARQRETLGPLAAGRSGIGADELSPAERSA